jgi:vitamin B12 transporter
MGHLTKTLLLLIMVFSISKSHAQTNNISSDTLNLEQINITASKIPQSERQTTKNVVIIDRAEIERNVSRNLGQLLNTQNGVIVNNSFSNRTAAQSIYLQGADNEYTLLMIDGIPISDPSGNGGALDLRLLPLNNVERIEIVKGSQSTLYGTNAIAGVINIITRDAAENPITGNGSISYGSFNTLQATANVNGGNEKIGYVLNYSYEGSDGISEAQEPAGQSGFDDDGINSNAIFGKVFFSPVKGLTITPSFNYSFFEAEFDAGSFADADNDLSLELINPAAAVKYEKDRFQANLLYSYTETSSAFFNAFSPTPFKLQGRAQNADAYGSTYITDKIQVLGGFAYQSFVTPNSGADDFDSNILSPYATVFLRNNEGLNAELGLRYNNHSEFGSVLAYNASPSFVIPIGNEILDDIKLQASVSSGFRAPTLSELFGPFGSNPDLDPESSFVIDGGVSANLFTNRMKVSVNYFNREIENLIIFNGATFSLINANRQEDQGIETEVSYRFNPRLTVNAFYNWLDGNLFVEETNLQVSNLIRRPQNRLGFTLNSNPINGLNTNVQWIYSSSRTDLFFDPVTFAQSEVTLDPFHLVNLFAEYSLSDLGISIFADIRNILDQEYNEVEGFNAPGINGNIGIRVSIN